MVLQRLDMSATHTVGFLRVLDGDGRAVRMGNGAQHGVYTLELPWRKNERNTSCVPAGVYDIVLEPSAAFGRDLWELKDVPGRSEVKIHAANFTAQLRGCIAPALELRDINSDGIPDAANSRLALAALHEAMWSTRSSTITILDPK